MTQKNTPFAITLDVGSSLENRTGSWRTVKPTYVNRLPPCNAKCPAGEKCQVGVAVCGRVGQLRRSLEAHHGRQSVPGLHGARVLSHL